MRATVDTGVPDLDEPNWKTFPVTVRSTGKIRVFHQNKIAIGVINTMNVESLTNFSTWLPRGTPFNSVNVRSGLWVMSRLIHCNVDRIGGATLTIVSASWNEGSYSDIPVPKVKVTAENLSNEVVFLDCVKTEE